MRLINADEIQYTKDWVVTDRIPKVGGYNAKAIYRVTKEEIDAMPTVDAVPVVHGRWVTDGIMMDCGEYLMTRCTACGTPFKYGYDMPYCPQCGAKMDERGNDSETD